MVYTCVLFAKTVLNVMTYQTYITFDMIKKNVCALNTYSQMHWDKLVRYYTAIKFWC